MVVLYLGLAAASVGVLGSKPSQVPLADLMAAGLGETGRTVTAVLAVLLTMGTMNTYVAAAVKLAGALDDAPALLARPRNALAMFAAVAAAVLTPLAIDVLSLDDLIHATNAVFIAVYVTATAAGIRLLDGSARVAAAIAFVAVVIVFAFSGWFVLVPIAISSSLQVAALTTTRRRRSRARATTGAASAACS